MSNIGLLFGGVSYEHEISIVSAIALSKVLEFEVHYIFCDLNKDFYLIPKGDLNISLFKENRYKKYQKLYLSKNALVLKTFMRKNKINITILINVIHGQNGEDGTISGLLDFYDIKYIGPSIEASVVSYNKALTKLYADSLGIHRLNYNILNANNRNISLDLPIIVKPLRLGSSIGVSVVRNKDELDYALDVAFEFGSEVIVEPFIKDVKEYNLAGYKVGDDFKFSIIESPNKGDILDFKKKYFDFSNTKKIKKADIANHIKEKLEETFKKIYIPLFYNSIIRCDFFLIDENVYINEINTTPGSLANYLFKDFSKLIFSFANSIKTKESITVNYNYLESISVDK